MGNNKQYPTGGRGNPPGVVGSRGDPPLMDRLKGDPPVNVETWDGPAKVDRYGGALREMNISRNGTN